MIPLLAAAIAFAPPVDRPIRYVIVEHRPTRQGDAAYTLREEAGFVRTGDGYVLTLRATAYTIAAPAAQRALLRATMAPILDNPVRIRLSAGGVPTGVVDAAATWAAFVRGVRAMAARSPGDAAIARTADALAALPPADRDALLLENAELVAAPRLPPLTPGQIVADGAATVARLPDGDGGERFRRVTQRTAPGGGTLETEDVVTVEPGDGLVRRRVRTVRLLRSGAAAVPVGRSETLLVR